MATADPFTQPGEAAQPSPTEILEKNQDADFRGPFETGQDTPAPVDLDGDPETEGDQDDGSDGPVSVADQRAAGVPADQTVTMAEQRAGAKTGAGQGQDAGHESEEQLPEHFLAGSGMPGDPMHDGISN